MKIKYALRMTMVGAVLIGLTGCGAKTTTAAGATPSKSSSQRGNFQPKFQFTTNPSPPAAGTKFTLKVSMQNRGGFRGSPGGSPRNSPGNSTSNGGSFKKGAGSNRSNSSNSSNGRTGTRPSGGSFHQPSMTAVISGNSLKQSVPLTFNQGTFTGSTTIQKKGDYTVQVTMKMGSRNVTKSFSLKVQ